MEPVNNNSFKQIFRDHWKHFTALSPRFDTIYYHSIIQKMLDCGDPEKMGFAQYRCSTCGHKRRIAFSCKSCFCLSCAKGYSDKWADFISRRLLHYVTYKHNVLTTPEFLRTYFFKYPYLFTELMKTANACLSDTLRKCSKKKLTIGTIVVLQLAGRATNYNPHLHIIFTCGGFTPDGKWHHVNFIPYKLLHRKWQYYLINLLRNKVPKEDANIKGDLLKAWDDYPKGFVAYIEKGQVPPQAKGLAKYLAKYLVSPPISVKRIEQYDDKTVRFRYKDHKTGQIKHDCLPVLKFIGRMVQTILPKGFQRIRHYGLHSNARYKKTRNQLEQVHQQPMPENTRGYRILPNRPFAQRFQEAFGKDPLSCSNCQDTMVLECIHHPKYGIVKKYELFEDITDEQQLQPRQQSERIAI